MPTPSGPRWWLADGEERSRAAPSRFAVPPVEFRSSVRVGGRVKLLFLCAPRLVGGEEQSGERLWVAVTEVHADGTYLGTIQSDPSVVPGLLSGDEVAFEARHVVAIDHGPGDLGYDPTEQIAVDPTILEHAVPPTRLFRWHPDPLPRPIWFAALDGDAPAQAAVVTLGALVERWPELTRVFAAGDGDWLRHADRPEYITDSADRQHGLAAAALLTAAKQCLLNPDDPGAAQAEAAFERALDGLLGLHWVGAGKPEGVGHPGLVRGEDRVRLTGRVWVREAPDRPIEVEVSPHDGGTIRIEARAGKRRRPWSRSGAAEAEWQTIAIFGPSWIEDPGASAPPAPDV